MDRPPVPPRTGSVIRPRGPRPQHFGSETPTMPVPGPPPPPNRRVPRKPVGSAAPVPAHPGLGPQHIPGPIAHVKGPRPLGPSMPPPPQHPQHTYATPATGSPNPVQSQTRPVSGASAGTSGYSPATPPAPYPVSTTRSSAKLPYPSSPPSPQTPIRSPDRSPDRSPNRSPNRSPTRSLGHRGSWEYSPQRDSSFERPYEGSPGRTPGRGPSQSSGHSASTTSTYSPFVPPPYPVPQAPEHINLAEYDDVVLTGEDFVDLYDTTSQASEPSIQQFPSLLRPGGMQLNLPEIPPMAAVKSKFSAEWLGVPEFEECADISLLSSLSAWAIYLYNHYDADFTREGIINAYAKLFTFNLHTINWIQAEQLATQAYASLDHQGLFSQNDGSDLITVHPELLVTGVLSTLSGHGCYSHHYDGHNWCYSSRCLRESRTPTPSRELSRRGSISIKEGSGPRGLFEPQWHIFWGLAAPKGDELSKAIKKQYAIHELIYTESLYVHDLQVFTDVYGKLQRQVPSIMTQQREFCEAVFDKANIILALQKQLFAKLKGRQSLEGPYVRIIADLVLDWALKARDAYVSYAGDYLWTDQHLRTQMNLSSKVEKWFSETGHDPVLKGKPFQFFFNRIIPRALRYKLLLETMKKHTPEGDPEFNILLKAIDAANKIGKGCDEAVDRATKTQELQNINATIVFKDPHIEVDLKLNDKRRKLIKRGKMLRKSGTGIEWLETDVLLLDNFLILAKIREGQNGFSLYITKKPILLDLLVLRSRDDDPITSFSLLSGNSGAISALENIDGRPRNIDGDGSDQVAIYPIRISHLGRGGSDFTLYTSTEVERDQWCKSIIDAKNASSASAYARNSQPFWLRKLSDVFGHPEYQLPTLPVPILSTVMGRSIGQDKPGLVVSKSRVNCVSSFGADYYLAGLDFGLYFCKDRNQPEWIKCLSIQVDSLRVIPEFNFLLILSRGKLIWYRLDEVLNRGFLNYPGKDEAVPRGYQVTPHNKIVMFDLAIVKDRLEVKYLVQGSKRGIYSAEPIRSKAAIPAALPTDLAKEHLGDDIDFNTVDYFRDAGKLEINPDAFSFTPLLQSLVIQNSRGFEHVSYEDKYAHTIPVNNVVISGKSKSMPPPLFGPALGIFRVASDGLLLCYQLCCGLCSNNGRLMLPLTKFLSKPEKIAFHAPYLIAVSPELVEIRKIDTRLDTETRAKLCQVITGTDIRLLGSVEGQVRLAMAHPLYKERQLVVELVINEFVAIDDTSSLVTL